MLVVSSPSAVEECFTKNDITFANRPRTMAGQHLTYNSTVPVWAPYGHLWRNLRRVATIEIFSHISLQKSSIIREEEVYYLLRQMFKVSNIEPQKVDFKYLSTLLVSNIMMRMVAGKPCVGEEFACMDVGKQLLKEFKDSYFASSTVNICDFFPILKWVGYKGLEKNMIRMQKMRDGALGRLIEEMKQKKPHVEKKRTLIETLFSLRESEPEFYSDNVIKSIILMMFIGGTDTTATTLEWTMSLLLNHPEILKKVKVEIDSQVGHGRLINDLDIAKLPYLRCVLNETLRLYPTSPLLLPHFSSTDCTVGGYHIPQGTILLVNVFFMNRDPKVWEEPTMFKPERFEVIKGEKEGFKFIPFGIGRRACPGGGLALRVISLALGALIQCFDWERVGKEMVDMTAGSGLFLMSKTKPLEAVCTPCPSMANILSQL
nr:cytochrome p450 81d11 [Quercus suber]